MEWKIGEIRQVDGEWYQCIRDITCINCGFNNKGCLADRHITGDCSGRLDGASVVFKKLEKVGEPHFIKDKIFEGGKVYVQNFMVYEDPKDYKPICNDYVLYDWDKKIISIEIKQNKKEDMEEKKQCGEATNIAEDKKELDVLDSFLLRCWQMGWLKQYEDAEEQKLKPFDIEAAKAGKPVCTRDGRKARIVCFDTKGDMSITALITNKAIDNDNKVSETEEVHFYYENGRCNEYRYDLMMLHEKKEGWVNVYKSEFDDFPAILGAGYVYNTKEEAINNAVSDITIATVKIQWEE